MNIPLPLKNGAGCRNRGGVNSSHAPKFPIGMIFYAGVISLLFLNCRPGKENVDLLLFNANIHTVDDSFPTASAFAVRDGKFVAVGDRASLEKAYHADSLLDLQGKTVVPGLIDAHCHFYDLGINQQHVDLTGTSSYEEVLERVRNFHDADKQAYIFGSGWDQNDWTVRDFPDKFPLDTLYPETPVVLERIDGHAYLVNQKALDLAGITPETSVEGGEIVRKNGRLTGILIDNPKELVKAVLPKPSLPTRIRALQDAERICFDYGVTTVNDAGLPPETIYLIDSLQKAGQLSIRIYAMISATPENLDYYLEMGPQKTDRLNVRSFKIYADGALGSRGAALKEPYTDLPGHYGAMVTPVAEIEKIAERLAASEFQMNTHAIGDSANAVILRTYSKMLGNMPDRRWKVEHAQVVAPADRHYFAEGIIPSIQPTHATSDMYWAEDRLGPVRTEHAYAWKSLLDVAGRVALGTDFPVEKVNPFLTFYAAVARKDLKGYPEGGYQAEEALSRMEALKGMTIWAAYSNFEEDEKGSISAGKWADFVVLSGDILQVPEDELPQIEAEQVYVSGIRVK